MKRKLLGILLAAALAFLAGCGGVAKKSGMTVYSSAARMEDVKAGFGKYFEIDTVDSASVAQGARQGRYAVVFAGDPAAGEVQLPDAGFLVTVDDRQTPIRITMRYLSGSKDSGAAIVNPAIISGAVEVTSNASFTPKDGSSMPREELIASAIYDLLKDIEGK